jgi:hypothetical protein
MGTIPFLPTLNNDKGLHLGFPTCPYFNLPTPGLGKECETIEANNSSPA